MSTVINLIVKGVVAKLLPILIEKLMDTLSTKKLLT